MFKERMKVMPKIGKGIKNMSDINENLINVAKELEKNGLKKSSSVIREAGKVIKEAQYVGVQGYWLRN